VLTGAPDWRINQRCDSQPHLAWYFLPFAQHLEHRCQTQPGGDNPLTSYLPGLFQVIFV
jgi:hypothetical protein